MLRCKLQGSYRVPQVATQEAARRTTVEGNILGMLEVKCTPEECERLKHKWTCQNNESLHNMIASKLNKKRAQSRGRVYEGRGHRSIAVKNLGYSKGITSIKREQGLEVTGAVTLLFEQRLQRVARHNKKSSTEEQKRNRKLTKFRKKLSNQTKLWNNKRNMATRRM